MAQNFISGKNGYVNVEGVAYSFGKWRCPMTAGTPKVFNFNGGGFEQYVSGLIGAKVTLEGPWDVGNMPLVVGNTYTFTLGVSVSVFLTVAGIVNSVEPSN